MDTEHAPAPPPPAPQGGAWRVLLGLLALLLAAGAGLVLSLRTETGTRWWIEQIVARLPGVDVSGVHGSLLGGRGEFGVSNLDLRLDGLRLHATDAGWSGLRLRQWQRHAPFVSIELDALRVGTLDIVPPQPDPKTPPRQVPDSLALPFRARVELLQIGRLTVAGLDRPIEALEASGLELAEVHRIERLGLRWNGLAASGAASIGARGALPIEARLRLQAATPAAAAASAPSLLPAWAHGLDLELAAQGPLAGFDASAALVLEGQRLDASGHVTAYATSPLSRLDARFDQLDLRPLAALIGTTAPQTRLDGRLVFQFDEAEPLVLHARLLNALPGRWDLGRLPLAQLDLDVRGDGRHWRIERGDARLASALGVGAGRLTMLGQIARVEASAASTATPSPWPTGDLRLHLEAVALSQLDARAPALQLGGPLRLTHEGPASDGTAFGKLRLDTQLRGQLLGEAARRAPPALRAGPVRLEALAELDPQRFELERVLAAVGPSRLEGRALLRDDGLGRWRGEGQLRLSDFDPSLWLPGDPHAAWRQARNTLHGELVFEGAAPLPGRDGSHWLSTIDGKLRAGLSEDSRLGGVALQAQAQAQADGHGGLRASAAAHAGGNKLDASLLLLPHGSSDAGAEQFQLIFDAPALGRTGALARALGQPGLSGRAFVQIEAHGAVGPWLLPTRTGLTGTETALPLNTSGRLELDELHSPSLRVQKLRGHWQATLPPARTAPATALGQTRLSAELHGDKIDLPALSMPVLALRAEGTLAEHQARLRAVLMPPVSDEQAAPPDRRPLLLDTTAKGNWYSSDAGQRWTLNIPQLLMQPLGRDQARSIGAALLPATTNTGTTTANVSPPAGSSPQPVWATPWPPLPASAPPAAKPLLLAHDLAIEILSGPGSLTWRVAPGRAELAGASLLWRTLQGQQSSGAPASFDVSAEIEPFLVATLLHRLQPDFGWTGDLRAGARLELHARPEVSVDFELARVGGDLQIRDIGGLRSLGLQQAQLKVVADNGHWQLRQRLSGSYLGRIDTDLSIRAHPRDTLPSADATLDGQLQAQVESLSGWAIWVPAGWRLGGQLEAALQIGGTVGTPRVQGTVRGHDMALRHTLEGVDLREGTLALDFNGETASLTSLRFKAGEGTLEATGNARLGVDRSMQLDFAARRAVVLGRIDRRIMLSGDAQARLTPRTLSLRGKLTADEGLFDISRLGAPGLGDDVVVKRAGDDPDAPMLADASDQPRAIDLDFVLNTGPRLRLRGHGIDTRLVGELRLTAPRNLLRANGAIRTEEGRFQAYGQRLTIDRGLITFAGDIANPMLDIEAVRPNLDTRVGVRISGSATAPRLRLFSEPDLPETEALALLITGRPYDSLGGTDMLIMQRAALALLAGEGGTGGLFRAAGFDTFSLSQSDGSQGSGSVRETILNIGRQISDRVYVGYRRGINASSGTWELTYRIAERFTLRAQSGDESAIDLIWVFRWD